LAFPISGGGIMANPFAKKNPLLSLWLSAANAWAGAAQGFMAGELCRQRGALRHVGGTTKASPAKVRRRRRK